jgi:formylmethanofuran dehydrogenase subunit E
VNLEDPREDIERLIAAGDLAALLDTAAQVHGHYCPGLASGVKAAVAGCRRLGIVHSDGMEKVMAAVECNNCFVDGIQVVSGCTLGNNALIYRDLGRTAVTFYQRGKPTGLRVAVTSMGAGAGLEGGEKEEAASLFDRAVRKRENLSDEESRRFRELWRQSAYGLLAVPDDDLLHVVTVPVEETAYAPIMDSVVCSVCGAKVMESRARLRGGRPICLVCARESYGILDGFGIHLSV